MYTIIFTMQNKQILYEFSDLLITNVYWFFAFFTAEMSVLIFKKEMLIL